MPTPSTSSTGEASGGDVSGSINTTLESTGLDLGTMAPAVRESELVSMRGHASVDTGKGGSKVSSRSGGGRWSTGSVVEESELETADVDASGSPGSRRLSTLPGLGGHVDRASNLV